MTKKAKLIALMKREGGVSLAAASKSLGWQPHTVRATISGLRKAGYAITLEASANGNRYTLREGGDQ
ncbi:MAG: DUF3489 domain-containing protein [Pseudomonadota bacterium]